MLQTESRRRLLATIVVLIIGLGFAPSARTADKKPTPKRVHMVIDYGDGVQKHFTRLAWHDGMTVLDALSAAQKHPHGITIKYRGKGATAFLTKIDDLENNGHTRNWIYRVNNKLATRGFGALTLKPGDTILWKFGEYR